MNRLLALSVTVGALSMLAQGPSTRSFAYASAPDGVGAETVTRSGDLISGEMNIGAKHVHYEGRVAADGMIPRLEIRAWRTAAEARNPRTASVIVGRGSTEVIEHIRGRVDTLRFSSPPGLVPIINPSIGLIEVLIARARAQHVRSTKVPILLIDALDLEAPANDRILAGPGMLDVTFLAADTVRLGNGKSTDQMRVIIGADGNSHGAASGATAKDKFSIRPTSKPTSLRP